MKRKLVSLTLTLCLLLGLFSVCAPAAAAATEDWMETAEEVTLGEEITVEDTDGRTHYYYKLTSTSDGAFLILENSNESADELDFYIYDEQGNKLTNSWASAGSTGGAALDEAGTYYIDVYAYSSGTYKFTMTQSENDANEANNSEETATALTLGE